MTNANVIRGFDKHFPNGIFSESSKDIPLYNFKKMKEYCKQKGVAISKLTDNELSGFQIINSSKLMHNS